MRNSWFNECHCSVATRDGASSFIFFHLHWPIIHFSNARRLFRIMNSFLILFYCICVINFPGFFLLLFRGIYSLKKRQTICEYNITSISFSAHMTYSTDDASVIQSASFSISAALDQTMHFQSTTVKPWCLFGMPNL